MPTQTDPILAAMAAELRHALIASSADPMNPPAGLPPSHGIFVEYQRRGGSVYQDADSAAQALVDLVSGK